MPVNGRDLDDTEGLAIRALAIDNGDDANALISQAPNILEALDASMAAELFPFPSGGPFFTTVTVPAPMTFVYDPGGGPITWRWRTYRIDAGPTPVAEYDEVV